MNGPSPNPRFPKAFSDAEARLIRERPGASQRAHPAGIGLSGGGKRNVILERYARELGEMWK